jgi:hypothetical protein
VALGYVSTFLHLICNEALPCAFRNVNPAADHHMFKLPILDEPSCLTQRNSEALSKLFERFKPHI